MLTPNSFIYASCKFKYFVPAGFSQHDLKVKINFRKTPMLNTLRS